MVKNIQYNKKQKKYNKEKKQELNVNKNNKKDQNNNNNNNNNNNIINNNKNNNNNIINNCINNTNTYKSNFIYNKSNQNLLNLLEKAHKLYQENAKNQLEKYRLGKSDEQWMRKIMTEGTLKDKISALQIYIRDNPKTTIPAIQNLIKFAETKSKKDAILCYNALKMLFSSNLMPDYELKTFFQNAINKKDFTDKELIDYYFEHQLKQIYYLFINKIIEQLNDNLSFFRKALVQILIEILFARSEYQEMVLESLLNKFGDNDKQIVTLLNQNLGKIIQKKSSLILPLIKEIERIIFRPNINIQAQFYIINFINTIDYKNIQEDILKEIIKFFFLLFQKMVEKLTDNLLSSKILNQILRGINKIFPRTKQNFQLFKDYFNQQINQLFNLVHKTTNIKIKIQTLLFIFQVENQENNLSDRYYRVLYEILQDQQITHSSQTELFFDLLYFSIKTDSNVIRIKSFVKRLLQVKQKNQLIIQKQKQKQLAIHCENPFTITSLIFLGKILKVHSTLKTMINQGENFLEDTEEKFKGIVSEQEDIEKVENEKNKQNKSLQQNEQYEYDPFKREPKYSKCENSCLWELYVLLRHSHPTIRRFTEILLQQNQQIEYKGNPLLDFTTANFLDRFSFKNAKKKESSGLKNLKAKGKIRMSKLEQALQVEDFMKKDQKKVREEEKYFMKYFQQKLQKREGLAEKIAKKNKKMKILKEMLMLKQIIMLISQLKISQTATFMIKIKMKILNIQFQKIIIKVKNLSWTMINIQVRKKIKVSLIMKTITFMMNTNQIKINQMKMTMKILTAKNQGIQVTQKINQKKKNQKWEQMVIMKKMMILKILKLCYEKQVKKMMIIMLMKKIISLIIRKRQLKNKKINLIKLIIKKKKRNENENYFKYYILFKNNYVDNIFYVCKQQQILKQKNIYFEKIYVVNIDIIKIIRVIIIKSIIQINIFYVLQVCIQFKLQDSCQNQNQIIIKTSIFLTNQYLINIQIQKNQIIYQQYIKFYIILKYKIYKQLQNNNNNKISNYINFYNQVYQQNYKISIILLQIMIYIQYKSKQIESFKN
ncbi:hypothetical protein IMG5_196670 [Ichthyophthirius multifiliis]|uniref:CCAAT-binding factor domain-containing protein n=1 Tax=Ichthyophthirius multifiliis TaxID=5932 RepID=G0R573_ICHMU|nr:hypothetical protein IMG5_196670 [Ichthyophthirius multifiliis]EGR27397.1 hypothetical protein IMG5_196670 [Ichthyophthirius multifiliis]|eukprot:XP_004024281.1 hypothetical protein IMG5_196670 [Ichthyophthirius multifiliis]